MASYKSNKTETPPQGLQSTCRHSLRPNEQHLDTNFGCPKRPTANKHFKRCIRKCPIGWVGWVKEETNYDVKPCLVTPWQPRRYSPHVQLIELSCPCISLVKLILIILKCTFTLSTDNKHINGLIIGFILSTPSKIIGKLQK